MNPRDDLTEAFAELRNAAALEFRPSDVEAVLHTARVRKTRRMTVATAAVLVVLGGLLSVGVVTNRPNATDQRPDASPTKDVDPSTGRTPVTASPSDPVEQGGTTAPRTDLASQVRFLTDAAVARLRGATVDLPAWPTGSDLCPAGRFTFADGATATGTTDALGRPWRYLVPSHSPEGIYAELDGVAGDEMVVPIACGGTEVTNELLVLKEANGALRTLGYIPGVPAFDRYYPYGGGLVVEVQDDPWSPAAEQRRRYNWTGSRFVQTVGPTAFPARAPDVREVDLRNSYFSYDGTFLSFVEGWSGVWPRTTIELGEVSTGLLTEPAEFADQGDALVTITSKPDGGPPVVLVLKVSQARAVLVLQVGAGGVTGVVSHRIVNGIAEITVRTKAGQQVWRYTSDGYVLTRVP